MSSEAGVLGLILTIFLTFGVFIFALIALVLAAMWKIFTKAGVEGWKAIIPIYNMYILCQIVGINVWWVAIYFGATLIGPMIPVIGTLFSMAVSIYFGIIVMVSLARSFGKEDSYAVGLLLVPVVFLPMLGFSKDAKYLGNDKHMNDFIFDKKD